MPFFIFQGDPAICLFVNRTELTVKFRKIVMQKLYLDPEPWTLKWQKKSIEALKHGKNEVKLTLNVIEIDCQTPWITSQTISRFVYKLPKQWFSQILVRLAKQRSFRYLKKRLRKLSFGDTSEMSLICLEMSTILLDTVQIC